MTTDQASPLVPSSSLCLIDDLEVSPCALSIMKTKILSQTLKSQNCNSLIDISSDDSSVVEAYVYEESYDLNSEDEEYLPESQSSQSQIVKKHKNHNLRSKEIKIITKQQYLKPPDSSYRDLITIEEEEPKVKSFYVHKQESVKVNFKEELRGPFTKKTKMEYLFRKTNLYYQRKSRKIKKALDKLNKELS